jgi:hypothetical protein
MIIHIHEENDFIASTLPFKELTDEVTFKEGVRGYIAEILPRP